MTLLLAGALAVLGAWAPAPFLVRLGLLLFGLACLVAGTLRLLFLPDRARAMMRVLILMGAAGSAGLVLGELEVRMLFREVTTTGDNWSYFALRWQEGLSQNSLGFREREIPEKGRAFRIAVIGDSFTWGQGIDRAERFTERLQSRLDSTAQNYEILNFGVPGSETVDHVQTLRSVVLPQSPDFVLLQWYINDVEGHDKGGRPVYRPLLPSETATAWLHRHSALYYLVEQKWSELQVALGLTERYADYMSRRFSGETSPDMLEAMASLREFVDATRAAGVGVGIVAFPHVELVESPDEFSQGYLIDRVMSFCEVESIPCLDLREALAGTAWSAELWANRLDGHPGPAANDIAARALEDTFKESWARAARGELPR